MARLAHGLLWGLLEVVWGLERHDDSYGRRGRYALNVIHNRYTRGTAVQTQSNACRGFMPIQDTPKRNAGDSGQMRAPPGGNT